MNDSMNILLVDDKPDDGALIMRELSREFPELRPEQMRQVTNAQDWTQALEAGHVALVITEYRLSWTNGLAILQAVKARWPDCPVVMFTGSGSEEIAVQAVKAGLDDYITRLPKHFARLRRAVWSALEQARQRRLHGSRDARAYPEGSAEPKPVEDRLRQVNRMLRMLSEFNQGLARATHEAELLQEACRIAVDIGGYRLAWVGLAEQDEHHSVRPVAYVGYEEGYLERLKIVWADTERGRGPTGAAIRTGKPAVCKNVLTDPNYGLWRDDALRRGYMSSLAVPLTASRQTLGALNVYAAEPDAFEAEEVNLLVALANNLAFGLVALRTLAEHKRVGDALRTSEELYKALVKASPDAVTVTDLEGRITEVSQRTLELHGAAQAEDLLGKSSLELITPEDHAKVIANIQKTVQEGLVRDAQYRMIRKDGSRFTGELNATLVKGADGAPQAFIATVRDITERVRMEEALRESEKRYRTLAEAAHDMIFIINRQGRVDYVNSFAARQFGHRPDEIIGRQREELFPPGVSDKQGHNLKGVFETGKPIYVEDKTWFLEREVWLGTWLVPIKDQAGNVETVLGISRDITERTRAEEVLRRRVDEQTALYNITAAATSLDPDQLLSTVLDVALPIVGADAGWVMLADPVSDRPVRIPLWRGVPETFVTDDMARLLQTCPMCVPILAGDSAPTEPALLADCPTLPAEVVADAGLYSCIGIPLSAGRKVLGILNIAWRAPYLYSEADHGLLTTIGRQVGIALENAYLFQSRQQRMAELQALYETSLRLNAQLETSELLRLIVEQAVALLGAEAGDLDVYDPQRDELTVSVAVGFFSEFVGRKLKPGEGLSGRVFESRQAMTVEDYSQWPGRAAIYEGDSRMKAILAAPLLGAEGVVGVLSIGGGEQRFFNEHDIQLAGLFAAQAAVALDNARLHAEVQRRAREMSTLNKAGQAITSTLDLQAVLDLVIAEIRGLLDAEAASVLLYDPGSDELVFAASAGPAAGELVGTRLPVTLGVAGWVMREKQAVLVGDARRDPRFYSNIDSKTGLSTRSLLAVPLMFKGVVSGVVEAINKTAGAFTSHDLEMLELVVGSAAIAIANARLFEAERQQRELAETLREVSAVLVATLDVDAVLDQLLEQISRVVPNDAANVMLIEGDYVRVVRGRGYRQFGVEEYIAAVRFSVAGTPNLRHMVDTGRPMVIPNTATYPGWISVPEMAWLRSYAGAPIRVWGEAIGFLSVDSATPDFFGPAHAERLQAFADQAAIALENARQYEARRRQAEDLAAVNAVMRELSASLDLDILLRNMARELGRSVAFDRASLSLIDPDRQTFTLRALEDPGQPLLAKGMTMRVEDTAASQDVLHGRVHVTDDLATESAFPAERLLAQAGARSRVNVPLAHAGRVIGSLNLASSQPAAFGRREIALLEQISGPLAIAIENARLFEAERRRSAELEALRQASLHLTSSLELQPVLEAILDHSLRLVAADDAHVFLYDGDRLTFGAAMWADSYQQKPYAEPRSDGLTYMVARGGKRMVIPDVNAHPLFQSWQWGGAIIGLPLRIGDQVHGVMSVAFSQPHAFDENEIRVLELLADQAAVVIQNARLFEETRRRLKELSVVSEVALAGAAGLPLDESVARATAALSRLWPEASLGFLFVNEAELTLRMHPSYYGAPPGGGVSFPMDRGITGMAVQEQRPIRVGDVTTDSHYLSHIPGILSEMAAPLVIGNRAIGVVNVESPEPDAFSEGDLRLLATLAGQLATIFEKARLDAALAEHAAMLEQRVQDRTAEIRSQQARTQAILDALGEGVIVTGVDGTILYVNPAMEMLGGYSAEEVLGHNPRLWQSGQTPAGVYQDMWDTILVGGVWRGEIVNRRKTGRPYDASLTIAPVFTTDDGRPSGFVGVQHDITWLKELDRLKSEFVSNVSHELRTPLTNIKLYLNLLERGKPDKHVQYVGVLRREELRLEHLIEDLLALSRMDLDKVDMQRAPLDVGALAIRLVADREALAVDKGLSLTCDVPPEPVPLVLADEMMISQVLTNLVGNAMNYTLAGGTVSVRVAAQEADGKVWVTVAVQDSGVGIKPEEQARLSERFFRGYAAQQTGAPGTGLGLSICKEIIGRHKGHMSVESTFGAGSTFTVWLPVA